MRGRGCILCTGARWTYGGHPGYDGCQRGRLPIADGLGAARDLFTSYRTRLNTLPPNFDCAEIADDFLDALQCGSIYQIEAQDGKDFLVSEDGTRHPYRYHAVYVLDSVAFDPRFGDHAIPWSRYFAELQNHNPGRQLRYEIERSA